MANSSQPSKEEHLRLAGVVKGVHAKLRQTYKKGSKDYESIWASHLEDKQLLSDYADAMHHLATDVWTKHPETRIDWCRKTIKQYLFTDDGLKKQLEKDKKRKYYAELNANKELISTQSEEEDDGSMDCLESSPPVPVEVYDYNQCSNQQDIVTNQQSNAINDIADFDSPPAESSLEYSSQNTNEDSEGKMEEEWTEDVLEEKRKAVHGKYQPREYSAIPVPFSGKIRLLDVGSCYNPFIEYDEFLAIGVDISPAVDSVFHCDFLHLETTEPLQMAPDSIDSYLRSSLKDPITRLPRDVFHVVVFSLLLEYFPCAYQRWLCCERAYQLLSLHGILLVITPDSHHQNKNAKMMKSWKAAIESMGFRRWRYQKLEHLHCMAFRKVEKEERTDCLVAGKNYTDMLYIPQDYNDGDKMREENYFLDFQHDDGFCQNTLDELPDLLD